MILTPGQKLLIAYGTGICGVGVGFAVYAAATAKTNYGMWVAVAGAALFLVAMSLFLVSSIRYARRAGPPTPQERALQHRREDVFLLAVCVVCLIGANVATALEPEGWYYWVVSRYLILPFAIIAGVIAYLVWALLPAGRN